MGAALAIAEVFFKVEKARTAALFLVIELGATDEKAGEQRSFLALLEAISQAMRWTWFPTSSGSSH